MINIVITKYSWYVCSIIECLYYFISKCECCFLMDRSLLELNCSLTKIPLEFRLMWFITLLYGIK
jgi:hypothetical protein